MTGHHGSTRRLVGKSVMCWTSTAMQMYSFEPCKSVEQLRRRCRYGVFLTLATTLAITLCEVTSPHLHDMPISHSCHPG